MNIEIPIRKLKLPKTGYEVSIQEYLTTGQSRELQKVLLGKGSFDTEAGKFSGLTGDTFLEMQDKAAVILIKSVSKGESKEPFTLEWLSNLPLEDGNLIYEEINKITGSSNLSKEAKKK